MKEVPWTHIDNTKEFYTANNTKTTYNANPTFSNLAKTQAHVDW
jgi:hypothetical protein